MGGRGRGRLRKVIRAKYKLKEATKND